jgi:branched-chain amino acid transport system permease protein
MSRTPPGLFTRYDRDNAILKNNVQRFWLVAAIVVAVLLPFYLDTLSDGRSWLILFSTAFVASIGAIGLNLVTGYAGQVSLGHAFFLGVGAYAGAALSNEQVLGSDGAVRLIGLDLDMLIWLPAAGLIAAAAGIIVAPVALRLRGLYLALVTLGLVFVGEHIFRNWRELTGGIGEGREPARLELLGYRFDVESTVLGISISREQQIYFFMLVVMIVMALLAKNLVRSRIGRAFSAVRDRDIAAEIMGVDLTRYKVMAFAVSSFYAGVAGALLFSITGFVEPTSFSLLLSIAYIAMVVIGGAASIAGSIMGAFFITLLPKLIDITHLASLIDTAVGWLPFISGGADPALAVSQIERILFGVLIIMFLILEPLGLYGIWIRIRNYWKAFPFSY